MQLYINTATYSGDINLTNLQIEKLYLNAGASLVEFYGLANANFDEMSFNGGAGSYTFDFRGNLIKKSKGNIN